MKFNPLTCIDFYKAGHRQQYPAGTNFVYSNFTPRSDKLALKSSIYDGNIVFFGLQYFIKSFLIDSWNEQFFNKPKEEVVSKYKRRMDNALGKGAIPVDHIEALHDLGYLPIEIKALPENSIVPMKIPVLTIHNTLPDFFWLTNYLESVMSCSLWKACTSATTARQYRMILDNYAKETGNEGFVDFQAHDFSFRGMSGIEDAALSGAAHLLYFKGTDTVPAIDLLEEYYNANSDNELVGCSVPATEHSVMCMGEKEHEIDTFRRLITEIYPKGIVSIVSDTWDLWKVLNEYAPALKTEIEAREGKVVFRPDSGNPVDIICGDNNASGEAFKGCLQLLWEHFGGAINEKGYKELNPKVGLIYGDSITLKRCEDILYRMKEMGFASTNIVFGVGSFTYQHCTRDNFGFAMKATYGEVSGIGREIYKDPVTDSGIKKSARGLLRVYKSLDGEFCLEDRESSYGGGFLETVFINGQLLIDYKLSDLRK